MILDKYRDFLLGLHTDKVKHSGRSLYQHLCGTHDLLETWGNFEEICVAGLFHSIYGTRPFKHQTWPLDDRAAIRDLIGTRAEELVHLFCVIDRPLAIVRGYDGVFSLRGHLRELREVEAANLLEQGSSGAHLRRLAKVDGISASARSAIEKHLREGKHYGHARGDRGERRPAGGRRVGVVAEAWPAGERGE